MLFDELYSMDLPEHAYIIVVDGNETTVGHLYDEKIRAYRYRRMKTYSQSGCSVVVTMEAD